MKANFKLSDLDIYTSVWIPIGKSNMEALNRFIGSHKRYKTPTEFGISGVVKDMSTGFFDMEKHGVFITPYTFDSTGFLHAKINEEYKDKKTYGLSLYKDGLANLGIHIKNDLSTDEIKVITGKLAYKITDCVFPILNDVQQSLISSVINEQDLSKAHHKIQTYSLIKSSQSPFNEKNSAEIVKQHSDKIEAITDWVISHTTIDKCHLFIGMAAILCLGETTKETDEALRFIQYLQSCNKTSHQLHSHLWSLRKQIHGLRETSQKANYKTLKHNIEEICSLNSILLKIKVFDELLKAETHEMAESWDELKWGDKKFHTEIYNNFRDEVEKSGNRNITINQLSEELTVLSNELENRLELIMTRDSMTLNIILLTLTIISLLGVGEVVGFTETQWKIVGVVLLPFSLASFIYLRNFLKNFNKRF